jgi:hypothetical protein
MILVCMGVLQDPSGAGGGGHGALVPAGLGVEIDTLLCQLFIPHPMAPLTGLSDEPVARYEGG